MEEKQEKGEILNNENKPKRRPYYKNAGKKVQK